MWSAPCKSLSLSKCFHRLLQNVRWYYNLIFIIRFTDLVGVVVTLVIRIREVLHSILGLDTGYLDL
jgi:hypothetical protein